MCCRNGPNKPENISISNVGTVRLRINAYFFSSSYPRRVRLLQTKRKEYISDGNLLEKCLKRPFCCSVSILRVYFTYLCYITFWGLEYHFIENLKLILKENKIMK